MQNQWIIYEIYAIDAKSTMSKSANAKIRKLGCVEIIYDVLSNKITNINVNSLCVLKIGPEMSKDMSHYQCKLAIVYLHLKY